MLLSILSIYHYIHKEKHSSTNSLCKEKKICVQLTTLKSIPKKQVEEKKVVSHKTVKTVEKKTKKKKSIIQTKRIKKVKEKKQPVKPPKEKKKLEISKNNPKEEKKVITKTPVQSRSKDNEKTNIKKLVTEEKKEPVAPIKPVLTPQKKYINQNILKIQKLLQENLYYPRRARKRGITGEVVVTFTLYTDATVSTISVLTSNSAILSRAAIKTIERLSGSFPKPEEELILSVPIEYRLSN